MTIRLVSEFTIAGKPVSWQRAGTSRSGARFTQPETAAQEERVRWAFRASHPLRLLPPLHERGIFELEVDAYVPDLRARDWDNIGKLVSDALNGIAYKDDSQIWKGTVEKHLDTFNPRTIIRLYLRE